MLKYIQGLLVILLFSCNEKEEIFYGLANIKDCKALSSFAVNKGFNPNSSAFSTSEKGKTGLCLIDVNNRNGHFYQDPSWIDKGNLGPIAIDAKGNLYVAPVPFVNVMEAIRKNQNVIYKMDGTAGKLESLIEFAGKADTINQQNAYGAVGLYYDCSTQLLYVSSLQGSTKYQERGTIYAINVASSPVKIIDKLENTDAMGIGAAMFNEKKYLFYGNTRSHAINRIELTEEGLFKGKSKFCFSLTGIGPRGDDVAKKIRIDQNNLMQITGMDFHYNLTAPTLMQESKYQFSYNLNKAIWEQK